MGGARGAIPGDDSATVSAVIAAGSSRARSTALASSCGRRGVGALLCLALAGGLSTGCARAAKEGDFAALGIHGANSEPPPGLHAPVAHTDFESISKRGRLLYAMERALLLAYEDGMHAVGDPGAVAVLPLVDVDPGGNSAQVVFVRWPTRSEGKQPELTVENAERWLLVSIVLNPDQVLDVELITGGIEEDTHAARRIQSILAAAESLRGQAPGQMFHLLDLYETRPVETKKKKKKQPEEKVVAHVYALSADGDGPDVDALVDEVPKRGAPNVLSVVVSHPPGRGVSDPIVVEAALPTSLSVARAMLRGPEAGDVLVFGEDERQFSINARTGAIETMGEDPADAGAPVEEAPAAASAPAEAHDGPQVADADAAPAASAPDGEP